MEIVQDSEKTHQKLPEFVQTLREPCGRCKLPQFTQLVQFSQLEQHRSHTQYSSTIIPAPLTTGGTTTTTTTIIITTTATASAASTAAVFLYAPAKLPRSAGSTAH